VHLLRASLLVLGSLWACGDDAGYNPCAENGAIRHVFVETDVRRMWLCEPNQQPRTFDVRLGTGGVGKMHEGDGKVPLGTYSLGVPRPSAKYGKFIEIGYPTKHQRANGYTGSDVGVHGPGRELRWLGSANNWFDTTDGCVSIASDAEMDEVAEWVRVNKVEYIVLR
jgi:murein L,D-transpeptidase YafK